jgi:hypothetical protein
VLGLIQHRNARPHHPGDLEGGQVAAIAKLAKVWRIA